MSAFIDFFEPHADIRPDFYGHNLRICVALIELLTICAH
jgi:hypothetical protein